MDIAFVETLFGKLVSRDLHDLSGLIVKGWALVIVVWLACMSRIMGQRLYRQAQADWLESMKAYKVAIVDPQNSVAAFTDYLFSTWPYQVLLCARALGPVAGILLIILKLTWDPPSPNLPLTSGELDKIIDELPTYLQGMFYGGLMFIISEILLVVTNIRFGIKSRNLARTHGLFDPTGNPYHELSRATGEATESVTRGLASLQEVMGEYRENIVSSIEKFQENSVEMQKRHFTEVQGVTDQTANMLRDACREITVECSGVASVIRDAANESGTLRPLLTTLSECTDRLSQQAGELQDQVANLDPLAFATGAAEVGESGRRIEESNRETNRLLTEKLEGISESLDRTTALATKNLESFVTAAAELLAEVKRLREAEIQAEERQVDRLRTASETFAGAVTSLNETLDKAELVPILDDGRAGKKTRRRLTGRGNKPTGQLDRPSKSSDVESDRKEFEELFFADPVREDWFARNFPTLRRWFGRG